jgi:hypothetical protein
MVMTLSYLFRILSVSSKTAEQCAEANLAITRGLESSVWLVMTFSFCREPKVCWRHSDFLGDC